MSDNTISVTVLLHEGKARSSTPLELILEEPLSIRIQGQPYAVVMRTPGDEQAHIAGFCLAEGILDSRDDIETIASCEGDATNVVTLTVTADRLKTITGVLERRGFVSQTSAAVSAARNWLRTSRRWSGFCPTARPSIWKRPRTAWRR